MVKPGFHIIAHDRRISEDGANDRQQLYGNTFQEFRKCSNSATENNREQSSASICQEFSDWAIEIFPQCIYISY